MWHSDSHLLIEVTVHIYISMLFWEYNGDNGIPPDLRSVYKLFINDYEHINCAAASNIEE